MKKVRSLTEWAKEHLSALTIALLVVLTIGLLVAGLALERQGASLWSNLLIQGGGLVFSAAIGLLFFSFADVQRHMARTLGALLVDGRLVDSLSAEARESLYDQLELRRITPGATGVHPGLSRHLRRIADTCLSTIYVSNYNYAVHLDDDPDNDDVLLERTTVSFRLNAEYLSNRSATVPFLYSYEALLGTTDLANPERMLVEFEIHIGLERYGREAVQLRKTFDGPLPVVRWTFERDVAIDDHIDISMSYATRLLRSDPVKMVVARYPTQGISFRLTYSSDYNYDCSWFINGQVERGAFLPQGRVSLLGNGLYMVTHDWVLPGEGVAMSYTRKHAASVV